MVWKSLTWIYSIRPPIYRRLEQRLTTDKRYPARSPLRARKAHADIREIVSVEVGLTRGTTTKTYFYPYIYMRTYILHGSHGWPLKRGSAYIQRADRVHAHAYSYVEYIPGVHTNGER